MTERIKFNFDGGPEADWPKRTKDITLLEVKKTPKKKRRRRLRKWWR